MKHVLLNAGSVAVFAFVLGVQTPAFAQAQTTDAGDSTAKPISAPSAAPVKDVSQSATDADIVVTAHTGQTSMAGGGMIAIQTVPVVRTTVGQGFIAKQSPLQNSLASIRFAPGVDVGQDNPFGLSERSDLSVRGIGQTQMGFVVEGVPAGDPNSYLPDTNEWIDNENIRAVAITQGTSDLSSPVISASGGLVDVQMRDPSKEAGGTVSLSRGSYASYRGFIRLETGDIGSSGLRGMASFSYNKADNWRGTGDSRRKHVDLKLVKDWNDDSKSELLFQYNSLFDQRSSIPTLAQFQALGDNSNYADTYIFGQTNYYAFMPFGRKLYVVAAPSTIRLGNAVSLNVTPYYRYGFIGSGGESFLNTASLYYGNQLYTSAANVPYTVAGKFNALAVVNQKQYEPGVNAYVTATAGLNVFTAGIWYDRLHQVTVSPFAAVDQNGVAINQDSLLNGRGGPSVAVGNSLTVAAQNYAFNRDIIAGYLSDDLTLMGDRLKISGGVKYIVNTVKGQSYLPGSSPPVDVSYHLVTPRIGATFKIGQHGQIFADLVTNARPPTPGPTYFDSFNVSTGGRTYFGAPGTPAEFSFQQEIGYRYQGVFNLSVAAFHNLLRNHQVNTIVIANGALFQSSISAGKEEIYGVDAEFGLRPLHNFSPYVSAQYLHAETKDDFQVGADYLPTRGKTAVRIPEFQASANLTYDNGALFVTLSEKYNGSQYSTFMNDQKMPSYKQTDFSIGYRFPSFSLVKRPTIQLNLVNLFDGAYLGSIASPTGNAVATVGRNGTVIAASQPTYYENAKFIAMVTLKTDF
ncbi:TonB-dependent receptor [uncultured Sphingomonas sp.]|uniref:TonB-dependent receptor n=1 Tax=uncultured Sphingomonas sp. TaxID=158754 RepID=UPI0035CA2190